MDEAKKRHGISTASKIAHLYRRAGFGATLSEIGAASKKGLSATVKHLVEYEHVGDTFTPPDDSILGVYKDGKIGPLAAWWLDRMLNTSRPLQEKMTLFWHGHFATSNVKVRSPLLMYRQNQLFREKGMGRFDDLLSAIYQDSAMLVWLDGYRNTKKAPNENFGREVMELFTLGRGNYSEDDVHAMGRAFTGWRIDRQTGEVTYNARLHDDEPKTILGETGNWGAEDAVRILAAHPATGKFLAKKLWRFFASDQPPAAAIKKIASVYYSKDHSIREMVRTLLSLPDFYSEKTRVGHVKSPVEFVATAIRELGLKDYDTQNLPPILAQLGQELFNPPNVGGWPGGPSWINAATMLGRFNFASRLSGDAPLGSNLEDLDAGAFIHSSRAKHMDQLVPYIGHMLGVSMMTPTRNALLRYAGKSSVKNDEASAKVQALIHLTLISPEYQIS